jgi:EAL and modified HD-GYP domain-containing signal transduction protein
MDIEAADLFLGRQPILDRQQSVVGYELLFRQGPENRAQVACERAATAEVVCAAFAELGIANALGSYWGMLNVDAEFLCDDALELLPREHVVLELAAAEMARAEVLARCRELRKAGYRLALSGLPVTGELDRALLAVVDILRFDAAAVRSPAFRSLTSQLSRLPIRLLVGRVETIEDLSRCQSYGFSLFQGYYFSRPAIIHGRKLPPSLHGVAELISMLAGDADMRQVEAVFKRNPALSINLLRLTNSVGIGLAVRVHSVGHAINLLGRRQVRRWLQLLLLAGSQESDQDEATRPLMQLAALRGKMLELLAERRYAGNRNMSDMAFLTGMLSVTPAALGIPMSEILTQIAVAPEVRRALARGEGELGQLAKLVDRYDENDVAACAALLNDIGGGLNQHALNNCLTEALGWVQQLGRHRGERPAWR